MTEFDFELPPPPIMSSNAGKNSAAEQGVEVPMSWKPTAKEPVPVVRCSGTSTTTGERCKKWSLRGTTVCVKHGAQLPSVREHSEAVVESARLRMLGMVDEAIDGLEDLIQVGTQPQVRLAAIKEVLDRTGLKGAPDMTVEVQHTVSYKDEVANRLKEIRERKAAMESKKQELIEDAEIVDEPTEGE